MSEESKESNLQQTNDVSLPRLPLSLLHLPSSLGRTPQTVRQNQDQEIGRVSSVIDIIDEALELIDLDDFIPNDISNANRTYNPKRQ